MTDRDDVNELRSAQAKLVAMAQQELAGFFAGWDLSTPRDVRDALLEVVPALVTEYGDLAAAAAADWYEKVRPEAGYTARTVAPASASDVQKDVRYHAAALFGDDPGAVVGALAGSIQRHIAYSARETVARNVELDPSRPRFARIPTGTSTCAWCEMLASRGFVYYTEQSAGDLGRGVGEGFHNDCNCQIVPSWDAERAHIEGYDPEAMYDRYAAAVDELAADGNIAPTDQQIASRLRDMFPEAYRDARIVPSLVTDSESGWPTKDLMPVTLGRWHHIMRRHNPTDGAASRFPAGSSNYDIAKIIRDVVNNPDETRLHPEFVTVRNYFKTIAGHQYLVGTMVGGDGKRRVRTAFPINDSTSNL